MKSIALSAFAALLLVPLAAPAPARVAADNPVPYSILASSFQSGYTLTATDGLVYRRRDWTALWTLHAGAGSQLPFVDFNQDMVVASFMGLKPTSGYSIEVSSVTTDGTKVDVFLDDRSPGPTCFTLQVFT